MKRCATCQTHKPLDEFTRNKTKKDGRNASCKVCHRAYVRRHYQKNKAYYVSKARKYQAGIKQIIRELKTVPCADCKRTYDWWVMDFDHARGTKKFTISRMQGRVGLQNALFEIAKCDIVCSNCHRDRTYKRRIASSTP